MYALTCMYVGTIHTMYLGIYNIYAYTYAGWAMQGDLLINFMLLSTAESFPANSKSLIFFSWNLQPHLGYNYSALENGSLATYVGLSSKGSR